MNVKSCTPTASESCLKGIRKTDDKVHPGYAVSQGMVATTLEQNRRLLSE